MKRGILKKTEAEASEQKSSGIKWDEEIIMEHDKERGSK